MVLVGVEANAGDGQLGEICLRNSCSAGLVCSLDSFGPSGVCIKPPRDGAIRDDDGLFKVVIENITSNQPLTPPVAVQSMYRLYRQGYMASNNLRLLAEDGDTTGFEDYLDEQIEEGKLSDKDVAIGEEIIMPGESYEFTVGTHPGQEQSHDYLSIVSMLARTNDAFVGLNIQLFTDTGGFGGEAGRDGRRGLKVGETIVKYASVYDAGTEVNTENCKHIPAPPCRSVNSRVTRGAEGSVELHQGLHLQGDLIYKDGFSRKGARITITRMK